MPEWNISVLNHINVEMISLRKPQVDKDKK